MTEPEMLLVNLPIKPECVDEFPARQIDMLGRTSAEAGCIIFAVLQSADDLVSQRGLGLARTGQRAPEGAGVLADWVLMLQRPAEHRAGLHRGSRSARLADLTGAHRLFAYVAHHRGTLTMPKPIRLIALAGTALAGATALQAAPNPTSPTLTTVARFEHQVTGIAVTPDGRRFVSFPRWSEDAPVSVAELLPDGSLKPYPDATWNSWRRDATSNPPPDRSFVCVQSVVSDGRGGLWVVDPGAPGLGASVPGAPKLVRIDLATNRVSRVIPLGSVQPDGGYLNDVRLSPDNRTAYLTDSGKRGAIVVVALNSGHAWRALDGLAVTQADNSVTVTSHGKPVVSPGGKPMVTNADGITLSHDGSTLYWQALTGRTLYSIPTSQLAEGVSDTARLKAVHRVAVTHPADGLLTGRDGTIYVTAPGRQGVTKIVAGRALTAVIDPRLSWPDTMAEGPDGTIYLTDSHIPDSASFFANAPKQLPTQLYAFRP